LAYRPLAFLALLLYYQIISLPIFTDPMEGRANSMGRNSTGRREKKQARRNACASNKADGNVIHVTKPHGSRGGGFVIQKIISEALRPLGSNLGDAEISTR
jgi:hypothetical protein